MESPLLVSALLLVTICAYAATDVQADGMRLYGNMMRRDAVLHVHPVVPETVLGQCTCECCPEPKDEGLNENTRCYNDIVIAVDNSACFRDQYRRMTKFLTKLILRISREQELEYGPDGSNVAIMQFSSENKFPIRLDSFSNYTDPADNRALAYQIDEILRDLVLLGEGTFLNKALAGAVDHFEESHRPEARRVLILITNGNSHPDVTSDDLTSAMEQLENANVDVIPVAVTKCSHQQELAQAEWPGLCPDISVMDSLANVGKSGEHHMLMKSQETIPDILEELKCHDKVESLEDTCRTCNCSCELPVGPEGQKGEVGDSIEGEKGNDGLTGEKGAVGLPGVDGETGDQGEVGEKGDTGKQGEPGVPGEKGDQGVAGQKGAIGDIGVPGVQGDVGEKGVQGEQGIPGQDGEKGETGPTGEPGAPGESGQKGETGTKGEPGLDIKGEDGDPGISGEPGQRGPWGEMGERGAKGEPGKRGLCGKDGPQGWPGPQGVRGLDGQQGPEGPVGPHGPRGADGAAGPRGEPGSTGAPGVAGAPGAAGERGAAGKQGEAGAKGDKGEPSTEPGPPGKNGLPGQAGMDGVNGKDGLQGPPGPQGTSGPRGYNGAKGASQNCDLEELKPVIQKMVDEMMPQECGDPKPECREYPVDLWFLLDGSDSIKRRQFNKVKQWVLDVVDSFEPARRVIPIKVVVVQFSEKSMIEVISLVDMSADEIKRDVGRIRQMKSGTKTYTALEYINNEAYQHLRKDSFKVLMTFTDGDAADDRDLGAVAEARNTFNMMFAARVGEDNYEELMDFSKDGNIFTLDHFEDLEKFIPKIQTETCKGIEEHLSETEEPIRDIIIRFRRHNNLQRR